MARTKIHEIPPGLPQVGANLLESHGNGDNTWVSPDEFSFHFQNFSSARSHALSVSAYGSRLQNQWLIKID